MISILFAGSYDRQSPEYAEFCRFCSDLGSGLIERHRLLVAGIIPQTADRHVVQGAVSRIEQMNGKVGARRLVLYHTNGDHSSEAHEQKPDELFEKFIERSLPMFGLEYFPDDKVDRPQERYDAAFLQAIHDCDVVVLVGGGDNTARIYNFAMQHKKPVLGFKNFGGSGAKAYTELHRVYELLGITQNNFSGLTANRVNDDTMQNIADFVRRVHSNNPWSERVFRAKTALLLACFLASLGLWGLSYWGVIEGTALFGLPFYVWTYSGCVAACWLGGLLKHAMQNRVFHGFKISDALQLTIKSAGVGVVVMSFILTLVSLTTGRVLDPSEVSMIGIFGVTSILSFTAGYGGVRSLADLERFFGGVR